MSGKDHEVALRSWLAAGAPGIETLKDLCGETGRRVSAAIEHVDQFGLYTTSIHPEIPGLYCYWTPSEGKRFVSFTAEQLNSDVWRGCPAQICGERGRLINHVLDDTAEFSDRPDTKLLTRHGYKQFVYIPLLSKYTLFNSTAAFGTKGRFDDQEIRSFRQLQGSLARVVEAIVQHRGTEQILSTYVGRNAGNRVLQGNILRGDMEVIPSVVMFADLRDYTTMSNTLAPEEVIDRLNSFFESVGTVIEGKGGEILKFLGDGVVAIYPTPDDINAQTAAAINAASAIREIETELKNGPYPDLQFRAALDIGDIYYGNIGSKSRMDFTAIGPTVNRTARLMSLAGSLDADYVCSSEFEDLLPERTTPMGSHSIKGFGEPQEVFRLDL